MIDENGRSLGKMELKAALGLAREKGLDLIEVSAQAKPPVARIMSYDKYRYQEGKKEKKRRSEQRGQGMKQVQISIREAKNDLERKAKMANEFMGEKNQVEIFLSLRGREKANKDFAREKLNEFLKMIDPEHRVTAPPQFTGRGFSVQVIKR